MGKNCNTHQCLIAGQFLTHMKLWGITGAGDKLIVRWLFYLLVCFIWYTIKILPIFFTFALFTNLFYTFFELFLFIFYLFFTITVTPNPYPRSVSGSRIWLGGFWTGGFWTSPVLFVYKLIRVQVLIWTFYFSINKKHIS